MARDEEWRVRTVLGGLHFNESFGAALIERQHVETLALQRSSMQVDQRNISLSPGMNLAAEIKLGRRRVIDYLLDPIKTRTHESLRER